MSLPLLPPQLAATNLAGHRRRLHGRLSLLVFRLSLRELTRVIELYNSRRGTERTGCYRVDPTNDEDGFAPDATRDPAVAVTLTRYHSADTSVTGPRDGRINLDELIRVIALYNQRAGTVRTGQYHRDPSNLEDGFAPGP